MKTTTNTAAIQMLDAMITLSQASLTVARPDDRARVEGEIAGMVARVAELRK